MSGPLSERAESSGGFEPLLGTWTLNLAKSDLSAYPGRAPQQMTRTFSSPREGELKWVVDEVSAEGRVGHIEWTGQCDGHYYPSIGALSYDHIFMKRLSPGTLEFGTMKDGQAIGSGVHSVSQDGSTLTIWATVKNPQGETIALLVMALDKQRAP